MVNGIRTTWEEETSAILQEAKGKMNLLAHEKMRIDGEVSRLTVYIDALEKVLELTRQQRSVKGDGQAAFDPEKFLKQSVKDSLIDIASKYDGLLVVNDAVTILVEAKVFADREHARNSIYSNINHYKKRFPKERPGIYRFKGVSKKVPLPLNT